MTALSNPTTIKPDPAIAAKVGNATGKLGFLKWVEATFPAAIAAQVLKRAKSLNSPKTNLALAGLGQTSAITDYLSSPSISGGNYSATTGVPSASQAATSTPASSSWISDIGNVLSGAISAAGQAYLTVSQTQAANQIVGINLQRAQQGLAPLPYNAQQLGLTGPTLNVGLASGTLTPFIYLGGGLLAIILIASVMKKRG